MPLTRLRHFAVWPDRKRLYNCIVHFSFDTALHVFETPNFKSCPWLEFVHDSENTRNTKTSAIQPLLILVQEHNPLKFAAILCNETSIRQDDIYLNISDLKQIESLYSQISDMYATDMKMHLILQYCVHSVSWKHQLSSSSVQQIYIQSNILAYYSSDPATFNECPCLLFYKFSNEEFILTASFVYLVYLIQPATRNKWLI